MPVTDQDFTAFNRNFPAQLRELDWMEIIEALFLDSKLRGIHADQAIALALCRSGMCEDQAIALMQALVTICHNCHPELQHGILKGIVKRVYAKSKAN